MNTGTCSPRLKRPKPESDYSSASSAKVKSTLCFTYTAPTRFYDEMPKNKNNIIFHLPSFIFSFIQCLLLIHSFGLLLIEFSYYHDY